MCTPRQSALTRSKWDDIHQADDMRITSYAGKYAFTPFRNCPASFPVNPTIRLQESGASWVTGKWRTEVESDLKGVGRPSTRWRLHSSMDERGPVSPCKNTDSLVYDPRTNEMNKAGMTNAQDENTPLTFNRLTNPPCTLRASGWNRWEPLLHNPQANFETPFDYFIPARDIDKYRTRTHTVPKTTYTEEKAKELR